MHFIRLMIWKEFSQIKADPLMVRLMIVPVFAQLFIVGYALTTEVRHVPLAVLDRSNSVQSRGLIQVVSRGPQFDYRGPVASESEARELLDRGTIRMALVIGPGFAADMDRPGGAAVQLLIDGQDANSSRVAAGFMNSILSGWAMRSLRLRLAARGVDLDRAIPVVVEPAVLYNPLLKSSWYMIPALVVILVTMITSLLTGFSIVKEKERNTFEQLMVTPIKPLHVVIGKIVPYVLIGLGEIVVFLLLATLWFGIPFRGSVVTLMVFALAFMISSLGIGILTSTVARNSQQVLFLVWFILIFFILLSGFFIPIENMPGWVQKVTAINPVRYFMFIVREIFLKGSGFAELWREGLSMLVIGCVVFTLALIGFQRRAT